MRINKRLIVGTMAAAVLFVSHAAPAAAAGPVVGTWSIADHGQGCWGGGNLLVGGGASGGGSCAFQTGAGEEVASLTPTSWSYTDSSQTAVSLCATFVGKKGPVFPVGVPILQCLVVPVGTSAPVNLGGSGTFGKVTILPS
jgi:hypothetical protein